MPLPRSASVSTIAWMRVGLAAFVATGFVAAACGSSASSPPDEPAIVDASVPLADASPIMEVDSHVDAPPPQVTITVTSLAPAVPGSPGGKASAALAAWQSDDGPWQLSTPTSAGSYSFAVTGARWAIALVCADGKASSAISIHRRFVATTALEVTLEPECLPDPGSVHSLSGSLANVPSTTTWLELGYPLESRGNVVPVTGTTADYELVNVRDGTWDFAFGLRDESFSSLSRVVFLRGKSFTADASLDIDFAPALVPIVKPFAVHGLATSESADVSLLYAAGAFAGLAVGPQNVPTTTPDIVTAYDSIPAASQVAGDRYVLTLVARKDETAAISRSIAGSFHSAIDVDLTLLPVIDAPVATVVAKAGATTVAVSATAPVVAAAASYELIASVALNDRNRRAFITTFPPAMVADPLVLTPDLSALAGFDPSWELPQGSTVDVTAVAVEAPGPLSDGTRTRKSAHSVSITP